MKVNQTSHLKQFCFPYFILFIFYVFSLFLLLFNYSCLHFPWSLHPTPAISTPTLHSTPFWLCPCVLYTCFWQPFHLSLIIPFHLPSGCCQFVLYFSISGSILFACLLCSLASTKRGDHMVFVFHHLAYFT